MYVRLVDSAVAFENKSQQATSPKGLQILDHALKFTASQVSMLLDVIVPTPIFALKKAGIYRAARTQLLLIIQYRTRKVFNCLCRHFGNLTVIEHISEARLTCMWSSFILESSPVSIIMTLRSSACSLPSIYHRTASW